MATFSSVARRPGQTIKPKAAPRKNVQRAAAKPTAALAIESLTPESLPQSPSVQASPEPSIPAAARSSPEPTTRRTGKDTEAPLTPPPTAIERDSPAAVVETRDEPQDLGSALIPSQRNTRRQVENPISESTVAGPPKRKGTKRRSGAVEEADAPAQESSNHEKDGPTQLRTPASSVPARKRRKIAPQASASHLLSRSTESTTRAQTETPANVRGSSITEDRPRASTVDLLAQATASFGSVSKIADSIEGRTRSLRPRSTRASEIVSYTEVEDTASAVVERVLGRRKRKEPEEEIEDPENHVIDPEIVTMGSLSKDKGLGKRSATGKELDENWPEISQRWKERSLENRKRALERREEDKKQRKLQEKNAAAATQLEDGEEMLSEGPDLGIPTAQARIRNGQIVFENEDRTITFSKNLDKRVQEGGETSLDVRKIYNYVNSNNLGKHAGLRGSSGRWDNDSTDLFYRGLSIFGTDLEMIASLFVSKEREDIKSKYIRELRDEPKRVQDSLKNREELSIEEYEELIGRDTSMLLPETLDKELAEIKIRLEKEAADKKREENPYSHIEGADEPLQSIEVDGEGHEIVSEQTEDPVVDERTRRIVNLASAVVDAAATPATAKKAKRQPRRETSKITKSKKGKQTLMGVEEVIGRTGEIDP